MNPTDGNEERMRAFIAFKLQDLKKAPVQDVLHKEEIEMWKEFQEVLDTKDLQIKAMEKVVEAAREASCILQTDVLREAKNPVEVLEEALTEYDELKGSR